VITMSKATDAAVYNSRTAGMLTPFSFRRFRFVLILRILLPIFLLAATAWGQNWAGAEEQLAAKIVAATGPRTMVVEVSNRSSLSGENVDDIRRGLLTQLAVLGARFVNEQAATVRVSLSEDLQNYVWVAEIHQGGTSQTPAQSTNQGGLPESTVAMVSFPRPETRAVEPAAAAMVLHKTSLWSQQERILDLAVIDGNPAHMLVLDSRGVVFYRLQDGRWQAEQSLAIAHSRAWPRDLRGRLDPRKDHVFDAYLPGVYCRSTATPPLAMTCYEGDDPWPIGTNQFNLSAAFVSSRNYFSGALLPGVGKQTSTAPFYSAATFPRDQSMWWLFTAVDGQVHLLDGTADQVLEKLRWGSDIASVRSGCGSGWQVLASGKGEGLSDTVRAFEIPGREPIAASPMLEIAGSITALRTESGGAGAVAIVRNSETGGYEAFRLTLTCGR
jgi:hypothetical protein